MRQDEDLRAAVEIRHLVLPAHRAEQLEARVRFDLDLASVDDHERYVRHLPHDGRYGGEQEVGPLRSNW